MAGSELFSKLAVKITALVDGFIPARIAGEKEAVKQARVFLISHIFGPFIGNVIPLALALLDPTPGIPVLVLAASITSFWLFPFMMRANVPYRILVLTSVQNLIFCILWSCYFYGGVSSPTLPWMLVIPLLAFFYIGPSVFLRACVLALFAANLAVFCSLYVFVYAPPNDMPQIAQQGLGLVSTVCVCLYVVMMSFYYSKVLASQSELEMEVKHHLETAAQLKEAAAAAERADAAKSDFLAKSSHELRTPLNAVIGYSEMLLEDASLTGDDFGVADLERIRASGKQLLTLVNDVLDLSKIAAGKMDLYVEDAAMTPLIEGAVARIVPEAEKKGLSVETDMAEDLGIMRCDTHKVQQVLAQLLNNAVKFTETGTIQIKAERQQRDGEDRLVVRLADTGIGISEAIMPQLFQVFTGAEDYSSSKYGGTGLGLALSQKLCHMMGGGIMVESEVGKGSVFTIDLPAKQKAEPAKPEPMLTIPEDEDGSEADAAA